MTENISLRPWEISDLDSLLLYANNPNIAKNMTNGFPHPYTKEAGSNFIAMAKTKKPLSIFAICINNEAIGGIGVHPQQDIHEKCAELGYWLAEIFWGKGITSIAVLKMIDFAFQNFDIVRLYVQDLFLRILDHKKCSKNVVSPLKQHSKKVFIKMEFIWMNLFTVS
jgi:RimJ/RimL family protein N-acetyltransferase